MFKERNEKDKNDPNNYIKKEVEELQYIIKDILIPLEKKENFAKNLEKFLHHINHSIEQVKGTVTLQEIKIPPFSDEEILLNPRYKDQVEEEMEKLCILIDTKIQEAKAKKNEDIKSASQEIDHWRKTVSTLSILQQHLNSKEIMRLKELLKSQVEFTRKSQFLQKLITFEKEYEDASDYLKFLSTLDRSIKDLSSDDLITIEQSITGIFNNLKIIYLISKHKDQNKFGFLMEVMSKEICEKISEKIKLKKIFDSNEKSLELIQQATNIANKWKSCYLETKKKTKWDYSANSITGSAEYINKICERLSNAVKKVKEFMNFLGPELKRVIGGSSRKIDETREEVIKAYSLIQNYGYNIFSKQYEESCNNVMNTFESKMKQLEIQTIALIEETFKDLRSAESAYELYTNFENLISQENIKQSMKKQYDKILEQFKKEVEQFSENFERNKDNPPISKAKSIVAGKIAWARLLYVKMKRPISKIFYKKNSSENENNSNNNNAPPAFEGNKEAESLQNKFIGISKKLKEYEQFEFDKWQKNCESSFMNYLRNNILTVVGPNNDRYAVNFDPELRLLIRNTKFLDLYGFSIQKNIINIAHQEGKLARYCNMLNLMLKDYNKLMDSLEKRHTDLLKNDLASLKSKIDVGKTSHNWTSLGIEEFIKECTDEIKNLRDKSVSVFKAEEKIFNILKQIANAVIVKELNFSQDTSKEIGSFCEYYEEYKKKAINELLYKFEEISTIICEIEKISQDVKEEPKKKGAGKMKITEIYGKNEKMASYYLYWERCILKALTKTILKAIITLHQLFSIPSSEKNENVLFIIKSKFNNSKDIDYIPGRMEIDQILQKLIATFRSSGNEFIRWMRGTCLVPEGAKELGDDRLEKIAVKYSYGTYINENRHIKFYEQKLNDMIMKIGQVLDDNKSKFTKEFTKEQFGGWLGSNSNSRTPIEKNLEKNKSLKNFQLYLNKSIRSLEDFQFKFHPKKYYDGDYMINNEELISNGVKQIREFMQTMLKILATDLSDEYFKKFGEKIEVYKQKLNKRINDSESLKNVLDDILKIKNKKLQMELVLRDMKEKMHFLELHNYNKLEDLQKRYEILEKECSNLLVKAHKKDVSLTEMKEKLAKKTLEDVENLKSEVQREFKEWKENGPLTDKIPLDVGLKLLNESNERLKILKEKKDDILVCQRLFNLPATGFNDITEMIESNNKIEQVYAFFKEHTDFKNEMSNQLWSKFEVATLKKHCDVFSQKLNEFAGKKLKNTNPYKLLEELNKKFVDEVNDVIEPLKMPVIQERNLQQFVTEARISASIKFTNLTLGKILDMKLINHKTLIQTIVQDASKEKGIRDKMSESEKALEGLTFKVKQHKRGNEDKGFKFDDLSEEIKVLTENITNLQQTGSEKHAAAYKNNINELEQEMNNILEIIEIWVEVQKKWMYLESIFVGSEDIRQKLHEEATEFDKNDKKFRNMMVSVSKKPSIKAQCKEPNKRSDLKAILKNFEESEKKLTEHLDSKKNEFSRFYFLTEQDLLQILGSAEPLKTLNTHIVKLYENCTTLVSKDNRNITAMISQEEEVLVFEKVVKMESVQQVGMWMNKVDDEMKSTLQSLTKQAIYDFTKEELFKFIKSHVGMVIIFTLECWWTYSLEDVFRKVKEGDKYAMKKELQRQSANLIELVKIVRRTDANFTKQDRLKVNNMIIRYVHGREIVDKFVKDSILDMKEFEWESQLKFYWDKKEDNLIIRQCNGSFYSCYEYQGLGGRLVVTPLTDRCIMTLTTALNYYLGGAPAGPAGTGKTETVKDLGKGMGIRVIVQNCSNTLDYLFMGQFFSGLSQTGFWGCFDEFNRINPEVLSVITTQIKSIQTALANKKESWILLTKDVKLLPTIGIYITMNPNYEGRSDLPDNLKALFRPITMVTPDQLLICENLLLSEGFADSRKLAQKIDKLYLLCKEQLSKQHHYDWSLRTIKAVLSSAGKLKRQASELSEEAILMKAMKDMNLPKFIKDDAILFDGLIQDLFPDLELNAIEEKDDIKTTIMNTMTKLKYSQIDAQIQKIMQMYEIMQIRHTTMICGPPFSGKSCILDVLRKTVEELNSESKVAVQSYTINPKAQTVPRLYGKKNDISGDFEIGILANIFKIANEPLLPNKNEIRWVILDGDIDPIWIENMNSVMDDSKQLTLENKDRILMQKYCALIIEAFNIHHASLATISRLGIIYIDTNILPYNCYFNRWLDHKESADWEDSTKQNLKELFERYVPPTIRYVLHGEKPNNEIEAKPIRLIIPQYGLSMVRQLCVLLDSMLPAKPFTENSQLEPIFTFCLAWSVGACILNEDRPLFTNFLNKHITSASPTISNIFNCRIDIKTFKTEDWDKARDIIDDNSGEKGIKYNQILIPTQDTIRYSWLLGQHIATMNPCLFIGEPGTGKTVTIQNYLKHIVNAHSNSGAIKITKKIVMLSTNFSSRTSSLDFQKSLEDVAEPRPMKTIGPPSGKQLIVFIDDLGMPKVDKYETQEPLAFLKLLIEKKFFFTRDNKDMIKLVDTNYICSSLPPGGGNNKIDSRFVTLFSVFNITSDQQAMKKIFRTIVNNFFDSAVSNPQDNEYGSMTDKLIDSTLELYNKCKTNLSRSPLKFHYVFNMRDVSKIFQGFCQIRTLEKYSMKESLVKLWRNECLRIIQDKLITIEDKKLVDDFIKDIVNKNFKDYSEFALSSPCLFGDFKNIKFQYEEEDGEPEIIDPNNPKPKIIPPYEDLNKYENVRSILERCLSSYNSNRNFQKMDLVFYTDAIEHLIRLHRVLKLEGGNSLLVGVGGSGKQSLSKISTFLAGYNLWQINVTSRFDEKAFREQLIELFRLFKTNEEVTPISFLFTDEQILDEAFLELINNILTIGIVPAIFENDEKNAIIDMFKSDCLSKGLGDSKDVVFQYFINRIKEKLHLILCMSPSGDKLRLRCRNFPGLISNTIIDWFFEWPEEALYSVSMNLLANYDDIFEEFKEKICRHAINVHLSVRTYSKKAEQSQKRYVYSTPKNFLDYLKAFKIFYRKFNKEILDSIERLEKGLMVMEDASVKIAELKEEVEIESHKAQDQLIELERIKGELEISTKENLEKSKIAKETEEYLEKKTLEIELDSKNLEISIKEQNEINENVEVTISNMNQKDFDNYGKLTKFESTTGSVLKCFYFAIGKMGVPKWENIQESEVSLMLSKGMALRNKMSKLAELAKEVPGNQLAAAAKKMRELRQDKNIIATMETSPSLKGISNWVLLFESFSTGSFKLENLQNQLKKKLDEQEIAKKRLIETKKELAILNEKMIELSTLQAQKDQELTETDTKVKNYRSTLTAATELFVGLASEKTRWSKLKVDLKGNQEKLIGDTLLASSFLSYSGPFSFEYRKTMIYVDWKNDIKEKEIPITEEFLVQNLLSNDQLISQWNLEGLPDDELSVQNGILTTNATRWPLCIDPEMQAITWIKQKKFENGSTKVISFSTPNFMEEIKRALKVGIVVLIENVGETLEPNLNPVLEKNYKESGGFINIIIDGGEVPVDPAFKLFMTTKLSSPHYTPEIMGKTIVINYSVTMDGLEDQLLNEVVRHEYPDLDNKRKFLVEKMNNSKISLKKFEDDLLTKLTESQDTNILKNDPLIRTLKDTKKNAVEMEFSLEHSKKTKEDIDMQRSNYKPVAKRGTILYFSMTSLRLISSMYEYSLNSFMNVYKNSLVEAKTDNILNNRLENCKKKLTQLIYDYICLSIFEKHKLMFSFHMRTMLMKFEEVLDPKEMDFFLRGNPSIGPAKEKKSLTWLSDLSWKDMERLPSVNDIFRPFISDVTKNQNEWREWYDHEKPEDKALPQDYDKKISPFQKLLIVRIFRQDRIYNAIKNFIKHTIGEFFISSSGIKMEKILAQSSEKTPILFILSPGVDPISYVTQIAIKTGFYEKKFRYMSLGQKQEKEATDMIQDGVKRGLWILLQNCDLLSNWLKELEKIIDEIKTPKPEFRLWLTTSPIPNFPIGILQKSLKVVTEPPDGLNLNLARIYSSVSEESLENDSTHDAFKPLTFVLAFFHSVLQDRKKFGKIGWNVIYDFNESDFTISRRLLSMYLNKITKDDPIPWASLKYLIGEAMYGGRVTDEYDRRLMMTYLNEYMGDFIFDTNQKFFFSKIGFEYLIPQNGNYDSYLKYIETIPHIDSPEVIGLHSNAEIDYFTQASKLLWTNLLVLQKSSSDGSEKSIDKESYVKELSNNIKSKLPVKFDVPAINKKFAIKTPIQAVLVQEIERFNILLEKMENSLSDLNKAISGEIALNVEIEEIMNSLFNGFIPTSWKNLAPETQKSLADWIVNFTKRFTQYEHWEKHGEPKVMWLSGLHNPASYLKAIIQTTSRKKGWALDKTDTYTEVSKYLSPDELKEKPEYGCYISGLYLEGADWNVEKNCLEKQKPKRLLYEMPLIRVIPAEASKIKLRNNLRTPVYMTQNRKNIRGEGLVFEADLRTLEHPNKWILQGVCMVLNTYFG